ncbi:hypothetical protein LY56_01917 [Roseinatronobacter thiooxidans]|uniref:Uncharacterized protein n=1 Tax=Roseinatronobacter thiooxidans TaxID=121821 RepID=A0A2W7Q2N2_9RHOB|nr:hypothetical protein LY56_01917 [Roseinatronobacter thiooxidans]
MPAKAPAVGHSAVAAESECTVAQKCLHDQGDGPESRKLPAAACIGKEETSAPVRVDQTQRDRQQDQRHPARPQTKDQSDPAQKFGGDDHIGQKAGKPEALEKLDRACPALVGETARVVRFRSRTPKALSSRETSFDACPEVMPSLSAAAVKLPVSITAA